MSNVTKKVTVSIDTETDLTKLSKEQLLELANKLTKTERTRLNNRVNRPVKEGGGGGYKIKKIIELATPLINTGKYTRPEVTKRVFNKIQELKLPIPESTVITQLYRSTVDNKRNRWGFIAVENKTTVKIRGLDTTVKLISNPNIVKGKGKGSKTVSK